MGQLKEGCEYSCLEDAALCKTIPELLSLEALLQPNSQPPKCTGVRLPAVICLFSLKI